MIPYTLENFKKNCWATSISNFITQPMQYTSRRRIIMKKKKKKEARIWKIKLKKYRELYLESLNWQ